MRKDDITNAEALRPSRGDEKYVARREIFATSLWC